MDSTTINKIRDRLKSIDEHLMSMAASRAKDMEEVQSLGKSLVEELIKIPNWKCMVKHCLAHYEEFPDSFLDWCDYVVEDYKLKAKKGYSYDPDTYTFVEIDLKKTLEEQVSEAYQKKMLEEKSEEDAKNRDGYVKDMAVLKELGMEEISYETWLERKRNNMK